MVTSLAFFERREMQRMLSFDQPVPRQLVHRLSTSEVLPSDLLQVGEDEFLAALQWPRRHSLLRASPLSSALVAETIRQLTILTCHVGYHVPLEARFLMTALGFRLVELQRSVAPQSALELTANVKGVEVRRDGLGRLRSARMEISIRDASSIVAEGYGHAAIASLAAYGRMRSPSARPPTRRDGGSPVERAAVGVHLDEDVVVRREGTKTLLSIDPNEPYFFDHPLDHVPGVALIEACRQALALVTGEPTTELHDFESAFARMVEFGEPAVIRVKPDGCAWRFTIGQGNQVAMSATSRTRSSDVVASLL